MKNYYIIFLISFFTVLTVKAQTFKGGASFYADKFHGRTTASGERYDKAKFTAAHKTLPFGTKLKVTNTLNNKSVVVTVNDRGPFSAGRVVDLSYVAAQQIDMIEAGVVQVTVEVLNAAQDDKKEESNWAATGDGLYNVSVSTANVHGWGVQIASYTEFYNLLLNLEKLDKQGYKPVVVSAATVKGKRTFRVIIGKEPSESSANALKSKLAKNGYKGFVVNY